LSLDEDIIKDFQVESRTVLGELMEILGSIEDAEDADAFPAQLCGEFAQKIDRIMGAAKTLAMMEPEHRGLEIISKVCDVCKTLGYKAAEKEDASVLAILIAFWSDALEIIQNLLRAVANPERSREIADEFGDTLEKRLSWLSAKIDPSLSGYKLR
jgi:hypothetical protein